MNPPGPSDGRPSTRPEAARPGSGEAPSSGAPGGPAGAPRRRWKAWLWPALLAALAVALWATPWREYVGPMRDWVEARGTWGWIAFVLAYAVVVMLPLPAVAMSFVGGVVFGFWGFPLSMAGSIAGALPPYLIGRHWLRGPVLRWIASDNVEATLRAVDRDPATFTMLLRLTPVVPFTLQNWLLGLTPIRTVPYIWATLLGLAPGTFAVVWLGELGGMASVGGSGREIAVMAAGLAVFGLLIAWLTIRAMRALAAAGFRLS